MIKINKQKVVIIGHGSTSRLGIVRTVAELGCEISSVVMTWYRLGGKGLDTQNPFDCFSSVLYGHAAMSSLGLVDFGFVKEEKI